jgi:hypothetical protein
MLLVAALCVIFASQAQAHFLFARIRPPAEGGRFAEVYFSDEADAGDPRFIDKVAPTKLWLQTKPGAFDALTVHQTSDRLRALVPGQGAVGVIGEFTYGILARPKQPAFLLRHYPKAVAGSASDIAAFRAKPEIPFEIVMRSVDGALEFTVLRDGKPVPLAAFDAVSGQAKGHAFKADKEGKARWKPDVPGHCSVYTGQTLQQAGMHDGKKYDEIREFATIGFAWPLESSGADANAVKLFQEAMSERAAWTKFPGFSGDVEAQADGRRWKGSFTMSAKGDVSIDLDDDVLVAPWVKEQLESIALHRLDRAQSKDPVLQFADHDTRHPLGRLLLFEGGQFASSYRVKDRQIMVVNRLLGKVNMTITVLDNDLNADKKFLPRSYTIHYWNAKTGVLERTETNQNRWTRVGSWDLPAHVSVAATSSSGQSVKSMTISQHRLAK